MKRSEILAAAVCGLLAGSALYGAPARAEESEASRAARWHDVSAALFQGRTVADGSSFIQLDAPPRALDAALVPVSVTLLDAGKGAPAGHVSALYLVIDDNPAPLAGAFHFGPAGDPHLLKTRVRIDQYTLLHAVAEMDDGKLYSAARFIKAAGGCSAPGSTNQAEAMARLGRMKLMVRDMPQPGATGTAELLISHPNNNGMQMDPVSRLYTPARYVQTVKVSEAGKLIFRLEGDISLSQDPAITFGFKPADNARPGDTAAPIDVEVDDTAHAVFKQSFPVTNQPS